jgi:hypothetical protein
VVEADFNDDQKVSDMKFFIPIVALGIVFAASGAVARPMGHGSNVGLGSSLGQSPPAAVTSTPQPTLNQGLRDYGSVPGLGNPGAIGVVNPDRINAPDLSGALPGEPGSPTYDPNAALPALGNAGSALAPNPGTSAAGFNNPSVSSGTNPASGTGG